MYCGSSTYNNISCLDGFFFCTPTSLLSSVFLPNPLEDIKKEVQGNTDNKNLQASAMVDEWKKLKPRMLFSFCYPHVILLYTLFLFKSQPPRIGEDDIVDFTLLLDPSSLY